MLLRSIKMASGSTSTGISYITNSKKKERENVEKLLKNVKKEVKQIMEEAVTRKFVHEGSSTVTSLCAAVEACLSHGLKRRALGLFKTNSTTALLHKVAKHYEPAATISCLVEEVENADPNKTSSASGDSTSKSIKKTPSSTQPAPSPCTVRYLWIRLALFEKQLSKIIDHLVLNSSKYYEKDALVADPVDGPILASLLVGPCALDYSKMKTQDHLWTDLPADELVQRHRISGACHPSTPPSSRRLGIQFRKPMVSGTSCDENYRILPLTAREYVELLHQNSKATLLYGKNNVMVQPKESVGPIAGYLSLHQTADQLGIKWTPNQLMNGCYGDESVENASKDDKSIYWEYAVNVNINEIVYVHCHQQSDSGGTIVMVGQDGVQRPPIHFPKGGHLLAFLSCLENGLLPHGQLDPPLWSQRGRGKVFPKLRRKGKGSPVRSQEREFSSTPDDDDETADYVFRIISSVKPDAISQEMMDPKLTAPHSGIAFTAAQWTQKEKNRRPVLQQGSARSSSSNSSAKSLSLAEETAELQRQANSGSVSEELAAGDSLQLLCDTMKRQIISRAFYGWLAHCRHLRTVRTHLSGLVNSVIVSVNEPTDASQGLTQQIWKDIYEENSTLKAMDVYLLIYFGGIQSDIRKEVWPYLLGHYQFGSSAAERQAHDEEIQQQYETTMSEWLAVEAIVRQRDKEIVAAQLAKLSSESTNGEIPLIGKDHTLSNEVFEDSGSEGSVESKGDDLESIPENEEGVTGSHEVDEEETKIVTNVTPDEGLAEEEVASELEKVDDIEASNAYPSLDSGNHSEVGQEVGDNTSSSVSAPNTVETVEEGKGDDGGDEKDVDECQRKGSLDELTVQETCDGPGDQDLGLTCLSPASSSGGVYSVELLDSFALNLHRIDKDVQRCDRNYWYFTAGNLEKLRNVMCTYVWEHLDIGYVQGMCDLVAPLLVIFDDEPKTYSCFCELMKRMSANFPHGGAMDSHFANMRSLIQILDTEMFELMHQNGDYTHFYFCYRWFLLDFKRELVYDDVFSVWETIWAAKHVASSHFVLFIALALVEYYRDVILDNNMDFTDVIKFFNEMAEHHNAKAILKVARELVLQLQTLIDNK